MRWIVYCWVAFALYVALSALDLKLTAALLHANPGAYESNPFAAACLELHGWQGLAFYKAAGVAAFAGALFLLARRRPKVAAAVVTFGCIVLVAVTSYSHDLLVEAHAAPLETAVTLGTAEQYVELPGGAAD